MDGKLHVYHPKRHLNLFEYKPTSIPSPSNNVNAASTASNVLLFVGGLFDNFRTTSYVDDLASLWPSPNSPWRVMHIQLSSAIRGWGISDLDRDVGEIASCLTYIRSTPTLGSADTLIVLMGHSTGCQDVLHYIHSSPTPSPRPAIQGAILQAPVSDRESLLHTITTKPGSKSLYDEAIALTASTPASQHRTTILPMHLTTPLLGPAPINISRFLSLASPGSPGTPSADDLFSSDLSDERLRNTFGKIGAPSSPLHAAGRTGAKPSILILPSGADEYVPDSVSKEALLARWGAAAEALDPASGVVEHGLHDLSGDSLDRKRARLVDMRRRVLTYLQSSVAPVGDASWTVLRKAEHELELERERASAETGTERLEKDVAGVKL